MHDALHTVGWVPNGAHQPTVAAALSGMGENFLQEIRCRKGMSVHILHECSVLEKERTEVLGRVQINAARLNDIMTQGKRARMLNSPQQI